METTHYGENYIGNVIRIMDNRTLLVNAGSSLLQVGDTVQVYELGPEIFDLDKTSLGNYEFIKDTLKVIETNTHYSVCQKQKYEQKSSAYEIAQLKISPLFSQLTVPIPLSVNKEEIQSLKATDLLIHIGDPIKRI